MDLGFLAEGWTGTLWVRAAARPESQLAGFRAVAWRRLPVPSRPAPEMQGRGAETPRRP
ncbi:protein of unknown function [Candidatus Methylocalor cossyra]|uniref:Uncharacterized protein n=1 Tax=Candidatus Methylocalor cossyra TaxID=3108543 RepID=A0ABM9NI78_9GAMM